MKTYKHLLSKENGFGMLEAVIATGVGGVLLLAALSMQAYLTSAQDDVIAASEREHLKNYFRKGMNCQATFDTQPAQRTLCTAATNQDVPVRGFWATNQALGGPLVTLGRYQVNLGCRNSGSSLDVNLSYRSTGDGAFLPLTSLPMSCRMGCDLDRTISDADFAAATAMGIPASPDPANGPNTWRVNTGDPHTGPLRMATYCSGGQVTYVDAIYYHAPSVEQLCRCIGYNSATNISSLHSDGRNGFTSPGNNIFWYFDGTNWLTRPAAPDNRWVVSFTCENPICR